MNFVKSFLLIATALVTNHAAYAGELTPEQKEFTASIAKTLQSYFSSISSLSFKSTVVRWQNDKLAHPSSRLGPQNGSFDFLFWNNKFRIDDKVGMGPEGEETRSLMTFDGETYQRLHYAKGMLYIKTIDPSQPPPSEIFLNYTNFFFQAFEFLSDSLAENKVSEFKISEFGSDECYERLLERIISVQLPETLGGDAFIEFRGGKDLMSSIPTTYKVRFSSENGFFPVGWQRLDEMKRPVVDFTIKEFGSFTDKEGRTFLYPRFLSMSGYVKKTVIPFEDGPVFSFNVEIKDFSVNNAPIEDEDFSIDPAQANYIWDGNHSKRIKVPH